MLVAAAFELLLILGTEECADFFAVVVGVTVTAGAADVAVVVLVEDDAVERVAFY